MATVEMDDSYEEARKKAFMAAGIKSTSFVVVGIGHGRNVVAMAADISSGEVLSVCAKRAVRR